MFDRVRNRLEVTMATATRVPVEVMRSESFNYDARGILFPMNEIKNHLDS